MEKISGTNPRDTVRFKSSDVVKGSLGDTVKMTGQCKWFRYYCIMGSSSLSL